MKASEAELKAKVAGIEQAERDAGPEFQTWLKSPGHTTEIPGLVAHFTFDETGAGGRFVNTANTNNTSTPLGANTLGAGKSGNAVEFTGDDELTFPNIVGSLQPWERYSVVFRLKLPTALTNAVIFHRTAGTDVGFHGTELCLDDSHLMFVIKRFWPGNAIAVRSNEKIPADDWAQIGVSYDGSGQAEGMALFLNGQPMKCEIVRNHLYKSPENGGSGLSFGARFRSSGLKGALLDELRVYSRPLAPIEFGQLFDGHALSDAFAQMNAVALKPYYLAALSPAVTNARTERAKALQHYFEVRNPVQETSVMEEQPEPRPAYVLARGRYDAPRTDAVRVTRATPAALPPFPADAPRNRLGLAEWLTDPHHPLTARVAVNRFWQMLFGRGIVATTENFGVQGSPPTHPELLDWLARDFINSGWDVKAMLKKMVLSATYRQESRLRPDLRERDPENVLLARGPSQRLPAEMIRDTALEASGLLDDEMGGPPVSPYMPGDLWRESNAMSPAYHQSTGKALYRRSLYTVWKRTSPMPDMSAFDAPSREVCLVKRNNTGTPQQAFVLLNDEQFVETARALAELALKNGGHTPDQQIDFAFRRLAARDPDARETKVLRELLAQQKELFAKEPDRAEKLVSVGERKRDPSLNPVELAATTALTQAIMNSDATIWKR